MENPVDRILKNWTPAAAGFLAAVASIFWMRPYPPRVDTLEGVLYIYALAMALVFTVMGISAAAAFAAWFVVQFFNRANPPARLVWGIASRASWVAPLYLFIALNSGWALAVAVFMTLGLVYALRNLQPVGRQKSALSSAWQVFSCVLAAAAIESGFIASARIGAPMIALATLIVAWHATRSGPSGHPARGLITVFLAIVLSCGALVERVGVRAGDGFLGFPVDPAIAVSLFTLQKTFGGAGLLPFVPNRTLPIERRNSQVEVAGMAHRGIYLWPDVKKDATLVPPLPNLGRLAFGKDRKTPLTIPFYGAYWFFRHPYRQPPIGSLVVHGSPTVRQFVSNDNSPLWEEAHQNLQTSFDLSCCTRIEVDVTNADRQPELIEIELTLVDSSRLPHIIQPLGTKPLVTKPDKLAVPETLSYSLPPKAKIKTMNELIVRFRLVAPRWAESAQVAIERFRLVPKAPR